MVDLTERFFLPIVMKMESDAGKFKKTKMRTKLCKTESYRDPKIAFSHSNITSVYHLKCWADKKKG